MEVFPLSSRGYEILLALHLLGSCIRGACCHQQPNAAEGRAYAQAGGAGKKRTKSTGAKALQCSARTSQPTQGLGSWQTVANAPPRSVAWTGTSPWSLKRGLKEVMSSDLWPMRSPDLQRVRTEFSDAPKFCRATSTKFQAP